MIFFNFFKRDEEREVETLPTIKSSDYVLTDTLSNSKDNLLTAQQARELVDSVDFTFKEGLFEKLRWCAENGYSSHMVFRHERSNKTELLTYEYCVGVGKTELEELGYTVEIDGTSVTISW